MLTIRALCWLCRQPLWFSDHGFCRCCVRRLMDQRESACPLCGLPAGCTDRPCGRCLLAPRPWQGMLYVTGYQPPLSQLVKRLKYHGDTGLARVLARLMLLCWRDSRRLPRPDLILNVPLHAYRHWRRGYNQTELLAHSLSHTLAVPSDCRAVYRLRASVPQQQLNARQRRLNLRAAFANCAPVAGKTVALVDDVVTTGSTAEEITHLLLAHQARAVQLWCICRTL